MMGSQTPAPSPTQCGNTRTVRELWHDIKALGSIEAANAVKTRLHWASENHARSQKRHDTTRSRRDTRALQQKCNAPQCEMSVNLCDNSNSNTTATQRTTAAATDDQLQRHASDRVSRRVNSTAVCVCLRVCVQFVMKISDNANYNDVVAIHNDNDDRVSVKIADSATCCNSSRCCCFLRLSAIF